MENLVQRERMRRQRVDRPNGVMAHSRKMTGLLREARHVAATESTVLIEGETGVGKDVIAEYSHKHSLRKDNVFSMINCGALVDNLVDAELFGHEKATFPGAADGDARSLR